MRVRFTVDIDENDVRTLDMIAATEDRSRAATVRRILGRACEAYRSKESDQQAEAS